MFQPKRIIKYVLNGGIATLSQFSFLLLSVELFNADPFPMSVVAFVISLCVGFVLHRFMTFERKDKEKMGTQFFLVASMAVTNLLINTAAMYILLGLGVHYLLAQVVVSGTIVTWTFVGYNLIFKRNQPDNIL